MGVLPYIISTKRILADLNYRIDLPDAEVRSLLNDPEDQEFDLLLNYDQVGCMGGYSACTET